MLRGEEYLKTQLYCEKVKKKKYIYIYIYVCIYLYILVYVFVRLTASHFSVLEKDQKCAKMSVGII